AAGVLADAAFGRPVAQAERGLGVARLGDVAQEQQVWLRQGPGLARQGNGGLHEGRSDPCTGGASAARTPPVRSGSRTRAPPCVAGWVPPPGGASPRSRPR